MAVFEAFFRAFLALFIITDPLGNLPLFLSLTERQGEAKRNATLKIAVLTAFVLILVVSLLGTGVLALFNIPLVDFRVAGGILLFVIAIRILIDGGWQIAENEDVGAVPLGCPLIVGPGAITTTIVLIGEYGLYITLWAIIADFICIWMIFRYSNALNRVLGTTGSRIIAKVMAILIAAIAVKLVREGVIDLVAHCVSRF